MPTHKYIKATVTMNKAKTYILTVSRIFPVTHKRKGEETGFPQKILGLSKIHTIRANYELWKNRIDEVNAGKAVLSLRYWSGKPYNSKQIEFLQLKQGKCGVQKLKLNEFVDLFIDDKQFNFSIVPKLSEHDGLSLNDFMKWFDKYDFSKPMAIIHFTKFRY